jgi:hypothetical protein
MGNDHAEPVKSRAEPPVPAQPAEESQASGRPLSAVQVSEVVREVIRQLAPEELPVFDRMADDWLSDGPRRRRPGKPPGAAVGFGVETLLLTQLAFPIITAAIGEVLGDVAGDRVRLRASRRAGRRAATAEVTAADSEAGKTSERPARDMLTSDQVRALHAACERHARVLGMSAAKARLLADAVLGVMSSRPGGD